jgi:hypothetical protein
MGSGLKSGCNLRKSREKVSEKSEEKVSNARMPWKILAPI